MSLFFTADTHLATGLYKPCGFNMCTDLHHFHLFTEEKEKYWDTDISMQSWYV